MSDPQTPDRLAEIRERHEAATDGPWWFDESDQTWRLHGVMGRIPPLRRDGIFPDQVMNKQILKAAKHSTPYAEYWPGDADAAFISHAWEDVRDLLAEVDRLRADYDRLKSGAYTQASMLQEITAQCMAAELERDARLTAEDVERFLKRERDEYVKGSLVWQRLDDVLECFRLHMVTGTPLTEPRPEEGPSDPSEGRPPLTEAEELRPEVDRLAAENATLRAALEEVAARTVQRDLYRAARQALGKQGGEPRG